MLKIVCSMVFLLLRFLLEICCCFDGFTFICYSIFVSYSLNISLFFMWIILTKICCGEVLYWPCVLDILEASCTWMGLYFPRFEKFSAIMLLNKLTKPLVCMPLLLQCTWFTGLVFWWSYRVLIYSFCNSWVFLSKNSSVFSLISILSLNTEILCSTCSSLPEWL
jgi:hypothetical protein